MHPTQPQHHPTDARQTDSPVDTAARWLVRGTVLAIATSLLLHALIGLVAARYAVGAGLATAGTNDGPVEMAIMADLPLEDASESALELETPVIAESLLADPAATSVPLEAPTVDLTGVTVDITRVSTGMGGTGGDIDGSVTAGGAGAGAATFFGVEAQGARFVYVVDRSGSMQGLKLARTKKELTGSIAALLEHMAFHVVFYSSEAEPMGGKRRWTDARPAGKNWAERYIDEVSANGGTDPWPAFQIVFRIKPRPDAIYFMTDGGFDEAVAGEIAAANRGSRQIPIHCIAFGAKSDTALMRRIANESGGTYQHIPLANGQ